jgi:hypothetical protein
LRAGVGRITRTRLYPRRNVPRGDEDNIMYDNNPWFWLTLRDPPRTMTREQWKRCSRYLRITQKLIAKAVRIMPESIDAMVQAFFSTGVVETQLWQHAAELMCPPKGDHDVETK